MKRIVFATFGSLGDLHPYLSVGRELRGRGHDVVIATSAVYREKVEADGLIFAAVRPDESDFGVSEEVFRRANDRFRGSEYVVRQLIIPWLRASYDDLSKATEGADFLVSHPLTFAVPLIAEQRGLRWAATVLQPISFFSAYDPSVIPPLQVLEKLRGLGPRFHRPLFRFLQSMASRWTKPVHELRAELRLPPTKANPLFAGQFSPYLNLGLFSPVLAPPQPDWPQHSIATGFPFYDRGRVGYEQMDESLNVYLEQGSPPVVFTLGSTIVRTAGQFYHESLVAVKELGVRAILLVGNDPKNLPAEPLPSEVIAVRYAPFGELFHRAAVIVHQGGVGTTAQAMRAGKPQLIIPFAHDQPDDAARITRMGCGLTIGRTKYQASTAVVALRRLLREKSFSERAEYVGHQIRAENGAARAADAIERAVTA